MAAASQDRGRGCFTIDGIRVRGIVSAVPGHVVSNASFEPTFSADAIRESTKMIGVRERRWATLGQTAGDLCREAASALLKALAWQPASVDALIFVSQTADHPLPSTACILQHSLGLPKSAAAFDVGLGCSGYVYGLWLASALIKAGCRRLLLLAGDTSSRLIDKSDRSTALLFGDAGTATAVESDPSAGQAVFRLGTDGEGAGALMIAKGGRSKAASDSAASDRLSMDGSPVFGFTLKAVPSLIRDVLIDARLDADDIGFFVLHQANAFMLQHISKKLKLPADKLPMNLDRFGNTSSASIPLLLSTDLSHAVTSRPTPILMAGFGVGYSWGAAIMRSYRLDVADMIVA